jgi:hypothetical protein
MYSGYTVPKRTENMIFMACWHACAVNHAILGAEGPERIGRAPGGSLWVRWAPHSLVCNIKALPSPLPSQLPQLVITDRTVMMI